MATCLKLHASTDKRTWNPYERKKIAAYARHENMNPAYV